MQRDTRSFFVLLFQTLFIIMCVIDRGLYTVKGTVSVTEFEARRETGLFSDCMGFSK